MVARIDAERRVRLPDEWGDEFAPDQEVELLRREDGVLLRPLRPSRLQAALQRKFKMNQPALLDLSDVDMDTVAW
jgi:hypothetical protein